MENKRDNKPDNDRPSGPSPLMQALIWSAFFGFLMLWAMANSGAGVQSIPYSEMKEKIRGGGVSH